MDEYRTGYYVPLEFKHAVYASIYNDIFANIRASTLR